MIIPIVAVAALVVLGIWFWRRRKAKKSAEEERKNEMAEYGFNPNNDPTLPAVGAAAYTDVGSESQGDSGYRGWGTTNSNTRKPSTTLGSNSRNAAVAGAAAGHFSDHGSQPGGYGAYDHPSSNGTGNVSDGFSSDPLVNGHPENGDGVAALGVSNLNRNNQAGVQRGPSNASSAYSQGRPISESSADVPSLPSHYQYQEEVPYNIYNDVQPGHGPYGDGTYGGAGEQPVIRDVQARRNTKIERAPTFPQTQGGISQNF